MRTYFQQIEALARPHAGNKATITLVPGLGSFVDRTTLRVTAENGQQQYIKSKHFLLATGSRPRGIDGVLIDGKLVMTSDQHDSMEEVPRSIVIVGAGVVGCEFATVLANFGHTKVYLIDRAPRILPFEDEDICTLCSKNLEAKGVTIHHGCKLVSLSPQSDHVEYTLEHPTGARETIAVERALVSVGRLPNTEQLNLKAVGVELDENGYIKNLDTKTSVPNISAIGDVTRDQALVNVGEVEGRYAVETIYGAAKKPLSYSNISTIMFLDPEVAAVGLNEQQAQEQKLNYRVAVYGFSLVNRALAMRATEGFVKVICSDDEHMTLLGMRAVGVHASTTIEAVALAIEQGISACDFGELIHPHPAITEAVQECIRMLCGTSIYKPEIFPENLRLARVTFTTGGVGSRAFHTSA